MGIQFGAGKVYIFTDNSLKLALGAVRDLEVTYDDEMEPLPPWPAMNPFIPQEAAFTISTHINTRALFRLIYGRKRWRNKRKADRMMIRRTKS